MIVRSIKKDHVIAYFCLAKAYKYKGNHKLVEENINIVKKLLADPDKREWVEYFNKLVPKNEMNELVAH